jgi:hypothetical protein
VQFYYTVAGSSECHGIHTCDSDISLTYGNRMLCVSDGVDNDGGSEGCGAYVSAVPRCNMISGHVFH